MGAGRPKKYFQFIDEEYKNKYIEQYKDKKDASGVKSALKIIDVVECLYGKPFYEINNEAIISALRKIQSSGSVDKFFTIINDYARYSNELLGDRYFTNIIRPSEIKGYVKLYSNVNKLCSLNSLIDSMDSLDGFEKEKATICLLFEGLTIKDILDLRVEDLDEINEGILILSNRTFCGLCDATKKYVLEYMDRNSERFDSTHPDNKYFFKRDDIRKRNGIITERKDAIVTDGIKDIYNEFKTLGVRFCKNATELTDSGFLNYLNQIDISEMNELDIMDKWMRFENIFNDISPYIKKQRGKEKLENLKLFNNYYNVSKVSSYSKIINFNSEDESDESLDKTVKNELGRKLLERGELGEKLILRKLKSVYKGQVIKKMNDYKGYGYDFHLITDKFEKCIEVKTVYTANGTFFLTVKEIRASIELARDYYLVLAVVKAEHTNLEQIIAIRNPAEQLGLLNLNLTDAIKDVPNYFTIEPGAYKFKLINLYMIDYEENL